MWSDIVAIYRGSKKRKDINWFTEHIARPPAAVVVYALRNTPITPNQVTFLSAIAAAVAGAMIVALPGHRWLILAAVAYELSFVLDCADGQLARLRKIASPIGHMLDFLMDELKAMVVFGCVAVRMWRDTADDRLLLVGLGGLFCLAAGISLTSFTRRPEYTLKPATDEAIQAAKAGGGPPGLAPGGGEQPLGEFGRRTGPVGMVLNTFEWSARLVVHYPQYIWLCAAVNRIDIYFWAYAAVNALYFLKTLAGILLQLGRFTPAPAPITPTEVAP